MWQSISTNLQKNKLWAVGNSKPMSATSSLALANKIKYL